MGKGGSIPNSFQIQITIHSENKIEPPLRTPSHLKRSLV